MSDSKWLSLKIWFYQKIASLIPETSKRFVLYELQERAIFQDTNWNDERDIWSISFEKMYDTLKD